MKEKEKPVIKVRGESTILTVFAGGDNLAFSVIKRTEGGFERVDRYYIPVEYLLLKLLEKKKDALLKMCKIAETLIED